jgi:hypothetical protein
LEEGLIVEEVVGGEVVLAGGGLGAWMLCVMGWEYGKRESRGDFQFHWTKKNI